MPRRSDLPPMFGKLCGQLQYTQQVSDVEYSAECPACGGTIHQDGEWPDRLRIFADSKPRIWCRRCNHFAWLDELNGEPTKATKDDLDRWRKEQAAREEARKRSADLALAHLRKSESWEEYYSQLGVQGLDYWLKRGIPKGFIDLWRLGWNKMSRWGHPTATIPLFDSSWQPVNIKHRLIGDDTAGSKYRYELTGIPAPPFLCDPEAPLTGPVIAIEGEIKAMVTFATLDDSKAVVVGLPGSTPGQHIVDLLKQAESIVLVMDPGAREAAWKLVCAIGRQKCKVLIPPMKIDDGIIQAKMTKREVQEMLRTAKPAV